MACKEWKKEAEWYFVNRNNKWLILDERGENIELKYCPFCGYPLNEDGCTQKEIPYKEIIAYLNKQTDSSYKASTKKTHQLINARWKEGFKLEDFKWMIDIAAEEWPGTQKHTYIRPKTLFNNNMEWRLNQANKQDRKPSFDDRIEKFANRGK